MIIKTRFSKTGDARYISHLDLVRLFQRASRRAKIAVKTTQGFNPHLKISVLKALKLGLESHNEEALFYLSENIAPDLFLNKLNGQLPEGVKILHAETV